MANLQELLNDQMTETVKYKDADGKEHSKKVTLQEPSARVSAQILNAMAGAGGTFFLGDVMGLVMDNVLVNPKLNFEKLNKEIPASLASKKATYKSEAGGEWKITLKFPDWRTALNISTVTTKSDGSYDFVGTMDALLENVLWNEKGDKRLTWDDFDDHAKGFGLMNAVIADANGYLADVMAHNGTSDVLGAAFRLVQKQITRIR